MAKNEEIIKRAVIAGASHAIRYKEQHPSESEQDVLKQVMRNLRTIIEEIGRE
ncbi:MAG TPA: hypothetical protein VMC80_00275 [Patescibacteria group bacterium]|nr:hypothetical protein [Patescibacteria group bacterium]